MTCNVIGHPIVVRVDGSVSALRRLPLRLVHGVRVCALANIDRIDTATRFFENLTSEGRRYLTEAGAMAQEAQPDLDLDVDLWCADPLPMLIDLSEMVRLLVVGSRGSGGSAESWSVPRRLLWARTATARLR